jgi:hypothetical protein
MAKLNALAAYLDDGERQRVVEMLKAQGTRKASSALGIAPATAARLVAGLPVTRGTVAIVRASIAAPPTTGE